MPQFSRIPLAERRTSDLVGGLIWCAGVALVAFAWIGGWVLEAGCTFAGLLLLMVDVFFVGISTTGVIRIASEIRRRIR